MARDARRGSTRRCSSASAPRSTSTPASSRRRRSGCSAPAWSGRSAWRTSRGACGGATRATTRASSPGFARQYARHRARDASPTASLQAAWTTTSPSSAAAGSACRWRSLRRPRACACSASTTTASGWRGRARGACRSTSRGAASCSRASRRGHARVVRARRRRRRRRAHRHHARHAVVLAHRDRHARHPRGARRPAAAPAPGPLARRCARRSRRARPSSSPATCEKHRGFAIGEDVFVAHAPERIAAGRFFEEIGTLPCIVGGVGERSGERAAQLFAVFGAPIVQTTPVQAELAKIWTNILRYATFALPNLLMMDCEQYGANVFEVIDLINRDYPRGGMALPGLHRRDLPAQGLRLLRGALARAGDAARRLARARVRAAVPRRGPEAPARRRCAAARSPCSASPSRPTPTTSATRCRTSSSACSSASWPTSSSTTRTSPTPTRVVRGRGRRRRRRRRRHQPHRVPRRRDALRAIADAAPPGRADRATRGTRFGAAQVFALRRSELRGAAPRHEPRPRHRRRRHDRRGRRPAPAARPRLRGPRLRPARRRRSGCARAARSTPATCATSTRRARPCAAARTSSTWPRSSAGSRTSTSSRTRSPRSTTRSTTASSAPRWTTTSSASSTSRRSMVFERATQYPTTEEHIWECPMPRSAYGFSKLTGEVYCRAAHDEHGLPYTICRPFNAYGPGEMPEDEPGIAHAVPDLIRKCLTLPEGAPLPIFGAGEQTRTLTHVDDIADGIVTAMAVADGRERGLQHLGGRGADRRRDRARSSGRRAGRDPDAFALEHLPTFEVDVVRRWPSVEKADAAARLGGADRRPRGHRADRRLAARRRRRACLSARGRRPAPLPRQSSTPSRRSRHNVAVARFLPRWSGSVFL